MARPLQMTPPLAARGRVSPWPCQLVAVLTGGCVSPKPGQPEAWSACGCVSPWPGQPEVRSAGGRVSPRPGQPEALSAQGHVGKWRLRCGTGEETYTCVIASENLECGTRPLGLSRHLEEVLLKLSVESSH